MSLRLLTEEQARVREIMMAEDRRKARESQRQAVARITGWDVALGMGQQYANFVGNAMNPDATASNYGGIMSPSSTGWYNGANTFGDWQNSMTGQVAPAPDVPAPSRDILKRVVVAAEDLDTPAKQLATDAEALLGYRGLRKHLKVAGRLRAVLAKLEIEILDQKSVDEYKRQMVAHMKGKMSAPTWRVTPLRGYTQPVPEFALQKACEIKRELPEAEFFIDQLAVDPFLIVALDQPQDFPQNVKTRGLDPEIAAYVEVWDEPKFEAGL
jgi:hypothetical protein